LQWIIEHTQSDKPFANDDAYWQKVDRKWYRSGRRYRDLDRIADAPSRFFLRWLNHPSYDRFWRVLIPFGDEFKHIDVPLLTITGYYSAGEPAALYYWTESRKHEANGEHTLLIGPYDDSAFATAPGETVRGLPLDSAARLDLTELRYQWLDHIFKTAAQPALLKNGIDYELEGANNWGNATSLQAMANGSLRLYLRPGKNAAHRLSSKSTRPPSHVSQVVRLRDRSDADADWSTPPLLGSQIDLRNSVRWIGEPLKQPLAVAGRLKIALDFKPNKQDVDIRFALYELRPDGRYVTLSEPEDQRASYARDRIHRHLLKAGERQRLEITSQRLMARQVQAGSRLVFTLGVTKRPDREINYGAGKDVSEESVADAGAPLKILWYGDSSIELPVQR
jgi:putative CocE/NonD family hydrolase